MTLTEFLRARLDDDEQRAAAAGHGCGRIHEHNAGWVEVNLPDEHNARPYYDMRFIRDMSPQRVRIESEVKRRILERHGSGSRTDAGPIECDGCNDWWPCADLRDLAAIYDGHPDYAEEWRP